MLSALVVGLGQIGMGYDLQSGSNGMVLTHSRAFQQHPKFRLVGGVDTDLRRRKLFEKHYVCPAYSNLEVALKEASPGFVSIATPTNMHGETLSKTLEICRQIIILCEKPLSYDLEEAREMVTSCNNSNCRLYVNYIRRSDPGATRIKKMIEAGSISTPIKGIAWYSKGLFHTGSHLLNLVQFWLGEPKGFFVMKSGCFLEGGDPEPDFCVDFDLGSVYFLAAKEDHFSHYTIELLAQNGRLRYEFGGDQILWQPVINDPIFEGYKFISKFEEIVETGMKRYQFHVLDQISKHLYGMDAFVCTGLEALDTLESLEKIRSIL